MRACQSHLSMRWRSTAFWFLRLARLFRVLLKLLLEGRELGKRRIRVRLLVAVGALAAGPRVILLALGAINLVALVAARRTPAGPGLSRAGRSLIAALGFFLPLAAVLAECAVAFFTIPALVRALVRRNLRRRSRSGLGRRGRSFRSGRRRRDGLAALGPARAARLVRAPLGTAGWPPDLNKGRLFSRRRRHQFGRRSRSSRSSNGRRFSRCRLRRGNFSRHFR